MKENKRMSKAGDSNLITREYFDHLLLEERLLSSGLPDTSVELFGIHFDSPVMTAALSHLWPAKDGRPGGLYAYAAAAEKLNILHWIGMCENEDFERLAAAGAKTVRVIKPYADEDKILSQIECCKKAGAVACGIDIDHAFNEKGEYDICVNERMEYKSPEQIAKYVQAAKMPYVIKGILSVSDAVKAAETGASGIVISHHGGRMRYAVPPLYILPRIKDAVGDKVKIFVDCGIETGTDAYKALALGADAVSVGKLFIPILKSGGTQAVVDKMREMTDELRGVMAFTGVKDTSSFDASVVHKKTW